MTHIDAQPLQSCNQPTSCVTGCYLGGPTTPHRARARAKGRSSARAEQGGQGGARGKGGGQGLGLRQVRSDNHSVMVNCMAGEG